MAIAKKIIVYSSAFIVLVNFILFSQWFLNIESANLLPTLFCLFVFISISYLTMQCGFSLFNIFYLEKDTIYNKYFIPKFTFDNFAILIIIIGSVFTIINIILLSISFNVNYPDLNFIDAYKEHSNIYLQIDKFFEIATNGYINTSYNDYGHIFPLYPLIINFFSLLGNSYAFIFVFNIILYLFSLILFFNIMLFDYKKSTSFKATLFLILCPFSIFILTPMHVSLLLFFCLLFIYFLRKRVWYLSFVFSFLVSFIDPFGYVLIVIGIIEFVSLVREKSNKVVLKDQIDLSKSPKDFIFDDIESNSLLYFVKPFLFILGFLLSFIIYFFTTKKYFFNSINLAILIKDFVTKPKSFYFSNAFYLIDSDKATNHLIMASLIFFILFIYLIGNKKIRSSYLVFSIIFFIITFSQKNIFFAQYTSILFFGICIIPANFKNIIINIIFGLIFLFISFMYLRFYLIGELLL